MTFPGIENDPAALAGNPDWAAAMERMEATRAEYSVWVATQPIPWGHVLLAVPGDEIPIDHVTRYKWDDIGLVAKRSSKQGREVLQRIGKATTEEVERWKADDKAAADRAAAKEADKASADKSAKPAKTTASKGGDATDTEGVS